MQTTRLRQKERFEYIVLLLLCGIITFGLMLRDTYGFGINRYIFLALAAIPIFLFRLEKLVAFMSFLIPLYVGLPGNYISVLLVIRLLYAVFQGQLIWEPRVFVASICVAIYIVAQNIVTNYISVYHMMGAVDFVTLGLLFAATIQLKRQKDVVLFFGLGVLVMSVIMLMTTLKYYTLADLMNTSTRLGDTDIGSFGTSRMVINIDPNFLGMNAIAVVASCFQIFQEPKVGKMSKLVILTLILTVAVICLMGISRAYILVLVAWAAMAMVLQKNAKMTISVGFAALLFAGIIVNMFPEVLEGLLARFEGDDMAGGNGRINLILKYYYPWVETAGSMFFGIGLYECQTHCGPLLYIFGMGIAGSLFLVIWFIILIAKAIDKDTRSLLMRGLPFFVTFIMFSSIPAAGSINYTYPLLVSILAIDLGRPKVYGFII